MNTILNIENGIGIGTILKNHQLKVPPNQRDYSWDQSNVEDLWHDIRGAMSKGENSPYFLGTVVFTESEDGKYEIADGQQRLTTVTMIFAAIRDYFLSKGDEQRVTAIENDFLFKIDMYSAEKTSKISLNIDDNSYFVDSILERKKGFNFPSSRNSHRLIKSASNTIKTFLSSEHSNYGNNYDDFLFGLTKYLINNAKVLPLVVPDSMNAFTMFAVLNDRGQRTSQVDLVKNHLFKISGSNKSLEAQKYWTSLKAIIESISEKDDFMMEYLRWACALMYGTTREKFIFSTIEQHSSSSIEAIALLSKFGELSEDYSAIFNPSHEKWRSYDPAISKSIETLIFLDTKQMRPLILAVVHRFSESECSKTLSNLISWVVRLNISGGARRGRLDVFYSELAHGIYKGEITNYADLLEKAGETIPSDTKFKSDFAEFRVKISKLARYYLRTLESVTEGNSLPQQLVNDDSKAVNLEHVMPKKYVDITKVNWSEISEQDIETHANRFGNLALLKNETNSAIDQDPFKEKRECYKNHGCPFGLTNMIYDDYDEWGISQIEDRQKKMAKLASKAWAI